MNRDQAFTRRPAFTALALLIVLFVLYNANLRHGHGVDTLANTLTPVSLIRDGDFGLEEFRPMLDNEAGTLYAALAFGGVQELDGELTSSYPVGAGLVALPVFLVAELSGSLNRWHDYRSTAKIASALICATSAAFLYLCLLQLTSARAALIITVLYGLGTSMWPVISQDVWQHGPGMLCMTIALYCALLMRQGERTALMIATGVALSLAVICRPVNALPAMLVACYLLAEYRRSPALLAACFVPAALCGAWLAYYNLSTYGDLIGGYDAIYQSTWHRAKNYGEIGFYATPLGYGLAGILISPNKGALVYSPFLIFGFAAWLWVAAKQRTYFNVMLLAWMAFMLALLAKHTGWHGGTAYGSRYMAEVLVPMSLLLGIAWQALFANRTVLGIFLTLGLVSIGIQIIGVFRSPCGWAETPRYADMFPERHWHWHDMEIQRCLKDGLSDNVIPWEMINPPPPGHDF